MNEREPQSPEVLDHDGPAQPEVERRPADEEQPASHPDLQRNRPPVTEVDHDPSEGIAPNLRKDYEDAHKS